MTEAQERVWSEAYSDAELITAVRGGDASAYGVLYARHAGAAHTVARQYVRSGADADDVVADAFARTLSVLQNGGGPDVTFRAYLFTVVRRLSYDLVNGERRTQPTDDERTFESAFGPMASTEDPTLEGFERSVVTRAYLDLPERWRAVLWYTEVENLAPAEIAPILGLTANGVSALAYRAREGLRQAYLQQHLTSAPAEECQGVNPLLGSYVRGGLAKRETARVEGHLGTCDECRALVLELGDVSHGMRGVIAPLVLGVGALGLVGTALPVTGGAAVAGGLAAGAASGSGTSGGGAAGSGGASGSGGAAGTGGATAGGGAAGGGAAGGVTAGAGATAGTGAAGGAVVGAGAVESAAGAGGAAAGAAGGAAAAGAAAGGAGVAAVAGAGGLAALVASAPLAATAVTVGVLAVAGLGVAGALGVFTPSQDPEAAPTAAETSASPTDAPTAAPGDSTLTPTDPATDPTSPANIPTTDPTAAPAGDGTVVGSTPTTGTGGSTPGTVVPPVTPGTAQPTTPTTPAPTQAPTSEPTATPTTPPEPAPATLDLSLGTVELDARRPADLTVTATNSGGRAAEEVFVDLTLPPGVSTVDSSLVARGAAVAPALRAEALPCGAAATQADGTSVVTCSVGVLAPGGSRELVVQVQAESGGEYAIAGSVRAKGVEPVRKTFKPTPVRYFGAEVRVAAKYPGGRSFAVTNPGTMDLALEVRNSGDRTANDPVVDVTLPAGLSLVAGDDGVQTVDGWTCRASGRGAVSCTTDADLAPREKTTFAVDLLADLEKAPAHESTIVVNADAGEAHGGSADVAVDVGAAWAGAVDGLGGAVVPQCSAPDVASLLASYTNTTAYDDLRVTLEAAGSSSVPSLRPVAVGATTSLRVDDGVRFPAGTASLLLATTVAGETFEHRIDAGTFDALDCWTQPPWLGAGDVSVRAENVGGAVRYTATVANATGRGVDVRLLAPRTGAWADVADSAAIAPLRDGASGELVLDTGRASTTAADATLRQYRWHTDDDGDGKGYQLLLPVRLAAQSIAPAVPEPSVGQCVFDHATDTSSARVTLRYDNTASTLPVEFSVDGRDDLTRTVAGGRSLDVKVPDGVGAEGASFAVLADGSPLVTRDVAAQDCFRWSVDGEASVGWVVEGGTGSAVLTGTFRNGHRAETLSVLLDAGPLGTTKAVEVAPGESATFTVATGARDVAAGTVTFRATRTSAPQAAAYELQRSYRAFTYEPTWAEDASVEAVWQDGSVKLLGTLTNDSPETIDVRMLGGAYGDSAGVQKLGPGQTATFTVDTGALEVKPGKVTFRQYRWVLGKGFADTSLTAHYHRAAYEPDWSATTTATTRCVADSVVASASLRNDSAETMRVVVTTPWGTRDLGDVAPGRTASAEVDSGALSVKSGKVTFALSRTHLGRTFTEERTEHVDAVDCTVVAPVTSLVLGDPYYDARRGHSYRAVSALLDNSASNVAVTFRVSGQAKGTWEVGARERRTVELGEAPWSGASYVVHTDAGTQKLSVAPFSAAPQCAAEWQRDRWYDHSATVSYGGLNYAARNGSIGVRPDRDVLGVFWERGTACGENGRGKG